MLISSSRVSLSVATATLNLPSPNRFHPQILCSRFLGQKKKIYYLSNPIKWNSRMQVSRASNLTIRASARPLPLKNAEELINSVQTFILDCDGVIWKGDSLIDGVPETLDMLRSRGKRLIFVTNNSTKSRKQYGKKFETLGLSVSEEEIFASSFAAAAYLKSINFPKDKKADGEKKIELKPGFLMEHDENVGAVVVGFDRYFNYYKVQYGTLCIRENPGCLFIATNRDAVTHLTDAQEWAGGGSMVGALSGSTQREPLVVGKPSTFMMDYVSNKFGISKSQICMVGDRLDTDILFGQNGGCQTLLVLSGVTTLSKLQSPDNSIQPDFYTNKISDLLALKALAV
ncbi:phosphoglycolate phosphatase 1A, chloroplastic-like isoform X2 [Macadamia integrifolia]|uniref:phosphoglycolate phosphatase 1A, chloroplastic-like isoform X2 n=1 Tax=Macadamia integrifolia TaxID=60698 RepID=UPI001C4E785A|nr:phosphoglycolate phosphatase 1A, chloroplastic-like isoform X2 [Macadamia integrifolia]